MDARRVVMVFARAPRLGAVKTRLAAGVGEQEALRVHRVLLEHALDIAAGVPAAAGELWIAGDDVGGECARLAARRGLRLEHQCEGDLGARMHAALCGALRGARVPVLIGCDCPPLDVRDVEDAFDALERFDAVFAPTEDGGYALVGAARELPGAFEGLAWGGPEVMSETRRRLRAQSARWHELRTLWDLDDANDYARWQRGSDDR